jgi:hypothetical protein
VLEYVGRTDGQVKIRGHRVEPGEVEAVLGLHPGVRDAAVVAWTPPSGDRVLVAYVVARPGSAVDGIADEARGFLAERLPDHLVPATVVVLDAFPMSPNGKVDRQALPDPGAALAENRPAEATDGSLSVVEQAVALVWSEVLGVDVGAPDDDFFTLGGHSLVATRVMSFLRDALDEDVPLRLLFAHPTVRGFATALEAAYGPAIEVAAGEFVAVAAYSDEDVVALLDDVTA